MEHEMIKWYFFDAVYRVHEHEVYKACLFYSRDEHIAKDMTQKTFVSFYDHLDKLKPGKTRAYLLRTAKNMTMNWLRDFKRLREGQIDDLNDEDLKILSVEDIYIRTESERLAQELSESILTRLYQKNKRWYEVIVLAYYYDIPQDEIAKSMGVDIDVIYSRLYRAKQWIRNNYREEYENYLRMTEG